MKNKIVVRLTFVVFMLFITQLACGSSNEGTKIDEIEQPTNSAPVIAATYKIGDVIKVEDYTITLNSAEIQGSKLNTNFTIDNSNGTTEVSVSSILSFISKDTEGNQLEHYFCDGTSLDGSILVGGKLIGNVCWDGVRSGAVLKIYFEPNLFSSSAAVWEIK